MNHVLQMSSQWVGDSKDLSDFKLRWRKARISTLGHILSRTIKITENEEILVREVAMRSLDVQEALLKAVFHVGGLLASGMSRFFGKTWKVNEVTYLLGEAGHPCFAGRWASDAEKNGFSLTRSPCAAADESFVCSYWREAADGVITGLSDHLFFSRHMSAAAGDSECVDWVYASRQSPLKFGPIPENLMAVVHESTEHYSKNQVVLKVLGCSEGVLYYRMNMTDGKSLCGLGKKLWDDDFKRRISEVRPGLKFMEISPRAVLPEGA